MKWLLSVLLVLVSLMTNADGLFFQEQYDSNPESFIMIVGGLVQFTSKCQYDFTEQGLQVLDFVENDLKRTVRDSSKVSTITLYDHPSFLEGVDKVNDYGCWWTKMYIKSNDLGPTLIEF